MNRKTLFVFLFGATLLASSAIANAAQAPVTPPVTKEPALNVVKATPAVKPVKPRAQINDERIWNLKDVDIRTLIGEVAKITGKNFVIGPKVNAKVTFMSNHPLSPDELYQAFRTLLRAYGFTAIEEGKTIKIVQENSPARMHTPLFMNGENKGQQIAVTTVRILNYPASDMVKVIKPLIPKFSYIEAYKPSNDLIIADKVDNIDKVLALVKRLDTPSGQNVEIISLQSAPAEEIAETLTNLIGKTTTSRTSGQKALKIAFDSRTNSILISGGTPSQRLEIRGLAKKLDVGENIAGERTEVIYLKYIPAETIAPILQGLLENYMAAAGFDKKPSSRAKTSGVSNRPTPSLTGQYNLRRPMSNFASTSDIGGGGTNIELGSEIPRSGYLGPQVQWEQSTNSVIITAPLPLLRRIKKIIDRLDIRRPQVLIEAVIAEISVKDENEIGVEWSTGGNPSYNTRFGSALGTTPASALVGLAQGGLPGAIGQGFTFGYFRGGDLRALVRAISSNSSNNVLATPNILTLDNEPAQIKVGRKVSFTIGQIDNSPTGGNPFNSFDREDVGLTLTIKPQITPSGEIRLNIQQELSSLLATPSAGRANNNPDTSERFIRTTVMAENGRILVLGGLIQNEWKESTSKVPLLGDLPLIGALFRSKQRSLEKTNLMIFLRPIIIYTPKQGEEITRGKYEFLRQQQLAMEAKSGPNWIAPEIVAQALPQRDSKKGLPSPFVTR